MVPAFFPRVAHGVEPAGAPYRRAIPARHIGSPRRAATPRRASIPAIPRRSVAGLLWAAGALLSFSSWFVLTRLSVSGVLGVPDIVALRLSGGAAVLLPLLLREGRPIPPGGWGRAAALSACWGAPFVLLVGFGIKLTSAAHAAAMTPGMMPVFAGMIAWATLGEAPVRQRLLGFAVIAGGVLGLTLELPHPGALAWYGDAALLGGAALWATYTVRVRGSGLTSVQAAALVCLISLAIYLPLYAVSGVQRLTQASASEIVLQLAYQGGIVGGFAIVAFNQAVGLLGAGRTAAIMSLVPVAATLLGIAVLGEVPSLAAALATAAIAAGVYVTATAPPRAGPVTRTTDDTPR